MSYILAPQPSRQPYYDFLEELRKSGKTNMFGACPYLQRKFSLSADEAGEILTDWMHGHSDPARKFDSKKALNAAVSGQGAAKP